MRRGMACKVMQSCGWRAAAPGALTDDSHTKPTATAPDTLEEWVDFFRDPDEFYNATVSALLETFGSGGPTPRRIH